MPPLEGFMRVVPRLSCLLAATAVFAGVAAWAPPAAQASGSSLAITTDGDPNGVGTFAITLSGTATAESYLWVYYQAASQACGATPSDEGQANDQSPSTGTSNPGIYDVPAGSFTEHATLSNRTPGAYLICGYLEIPSSDPSQPGPMYTAPAAFADVTVVAQKCDSGGVGFAVTHFAGTTSWDSLDSITTGQFDLTVAGNSYGYATVTGPDGKPDGTAEGSGPVTDTTSAGEIKPGSTTSYQVDYYPTSRTGGDCALPDGTVETTGPSGTYHAPPVTMTVTWNVAGQGASAVINGTEVPGSEAPHPESHTPTISGPARVGGVEECTLPNVSDPQPAWQISWLANGQVVSTGGPQNRQLTIPSSDYGKTLQCGVADNSTDGFPMALSGPSATVGPGTLTAVSPPALQNAVKVGYEVASTFGRWSPANAGYKYTYQWYIGSAPIPHATKNGYIPTKQEAGKLLSCRVTATARGYTPATASTKAVKVKPA
jgi:hypothetical protein